MNVYDSIPHLTGFLADPGRNAIGALGERLAALLLQQRGYAVDLVGRDRQRRGDLRVVDTHGVVIRVEVKTARQGKDGKWRFLLWKKASPAKSGQDCRYADALILLAVLRTGDVVPFVIPMAAARDRSHICITSHPESYTGCWSNYRQRPGQIHLGGCVEISVTLVSGAAQTAAVPRGRQSRNCNNSCKTGAGPARPGAAAGRDGAAHGAPAAGGHS